MRVLFALLLFGCEADVKPIDIQISIDPASCGVCTAQEFLLPQGATVGVFLGGSSRIIGGCTDLAPGASFANISVPIVAFEEESATLPEERVNLEVKVYAPPVDPESCSYFEFNPDNVQPSVSGLRSIDLGDFTNPVALTMECRTLSCPTPTVLP